MTCQIHFTSDKVKDQAVNDGIVICSIDFSVIWKYTLNMKLGMNQIPICIADNIVTFKEQRHAPTDRVLLAHSAEQPHFVTRTVF